MDPTENMALPGNMAVPGNKQQGGALNHGLK
jgi:hypothetical protein